TPDSPPSGVFAASAPPAAPSASPKAPATPAPKAPATPAPKAPATPAPEARSAPKSGARVPPPVAPAGRAPGSAAGAAGRAAGVRGQAAAAPAAPVAPVGPDGTQAVPIPSTGARPAGAAGRPPVSAAAGAVKEHVRGRGVGRGPRRARLQLRHIDTWSALKISLVVSIALFFVWMVAVGILFGVLNGLGVFQTLNDLFGQLGSVSGGGGGNSEVITAGVVFGGAAVIGAINVVLLTALCTVGAVVYNLCSDLVGGVEVTLAEHE
ncbi:MAG TPA: DUF3566 domain-containing protein, partial [Modestobacter sp.]|nr:DUF3566 domain-containing protein [Modestobacter sp.]